MNNITLHASPGERRKQLKSTTRCKNTTQNIFLDERHQYTPSVNLIPDNKSTQTMQRISLHQTFCQAHTHKNMWTSYGV